MSRIDFIVPAGIADPQRPSGGNAYDLRLITELGRRGHQVVRYDAPGHWPTPAPSDLRGLDETLRHLPDGTTVLLDGLVGSAAGEVLIGHRRRLALVLLLHLPLAHEPGRWVSAEGVAASSAAESAAVAAVREVIVTSEWSRDLVATAYPGVGPITVARPGVDPAPVSAISWAGARLLSVGAVTEIKGYDVIADALLANADRPWTWEVLGSPKVEPGYAERLSVRLADLSDRVQWRGPVVGSEVAAAYARTDLLVVGSRIETYGMAIVEALARGIPVLAPRVGGVVEALGVEALGVEALGVEALGVAAPGLPLGGSVSGVSELGGSVPGTSVPGILVEPDGSAGSLAGGLRQWLTDPELRRTARAAAMSRRARLEGWASTAALVEGALRLGSDEKIRAAS